MHFIAPRLVVAITLTTLASIATAQDPPPRFVLKPPLFDITVQDLPGVLAAFEKAHCGKLLAEPDAAQAFATASDRLRAKIRRWQHAADALAASQNDPIDWERRLRGRLYALDWRTIRSASMSARLPDDAPQPVQITLALEPVPAAEDALGKQFDELARQVWSHLDPDGAAAKAVPQQIDGYPARVLPPKRSGSAEADGAWYLRLPGQFVAGTGEPRNAGSCAKTTTAATAGFRTSIDLLRYVGMLAEVFGATDPAQHVLQAIGLGECRSITWRIAPAGDLMLDEIAIDCPKFDGLLGALVHAAAPLVDQPLPEQGLLQIRCTFDVRELVAAIDELLRLAEQPTLTEAGLVEDIDKAWSGGLALAVARPPAGTPVPRLYVSAGIVDGEALGRLLARLDALEWIAKKPIELEGQQCTQLRLANLPPAVQPTFCVRNGVLHLAESGVSLRALLKAAAGGTPKALDIGDAPRPPGKGAVLPGFDLRFDGAAIHAALTEVWMPLWALTTNQNTSASKPLLQLAEMPDRDSVLPHLARGRGVLRQRPDGVTLAMSGTFGGPELQVLVTTFGPLLSGPMTSSWQWEADSVLLQVANDRLTRIHAAIVAFAKDKGRRPASLGELVAAGAITPDALLLPDDELAEKVMHEGKEVAKSSFRYYEKPLHATPRGEDSELHLVTIATLGWMRAAVTPAGEVIEGYGEFATKSIAEIESGGRGGK